MHERDWYLSAAPEEKPDTLDLGMENTSVGELDINGWELRKVLKLFHRSNGPLLEWLSSPLVYREKGPLMRRLRELAPACFSPIALWNHYRGLMEKSRFRFQTESSTVKTWFYMLRPLLCMRWIELGLGVPPMRFDQVVEGAVADEGIKAEVRALVEKKRCGKEKTDFVPPPSVERYINELIRDATEPSVTAPYRQKADLDAIFREAIE
jgi:predicted nucleotidyltransferase